MTDNEIPTGEPGEPEPERDKDYATEPLTTAPGVGGAAVDRLLAFSGPDVVDYEEGDAWMAFNDVAFADDLETAAWYARKATRLRVRRAEVERVLKDQRAMLDAWFERETAALDRDLEFFLGRLRAFHVARLADDPKHAKTVRLPDGTELRSQAGKLSTVVDDAQQLIDWATDQGLGEEVLRWPDPSPDLTELAKRYGAKAQAETEPGEYPAVADGGEVVPGVKIKRGDRTYTVATPENVTKE